MLKHTGIKVVFIGKKKRKPKTLKLEVKIIRYTNHKLSIPQSVLGENIILKMLYRSPVIGSNQLRRYCKPYVPLVENLQYK